MGKFSKNRETKVARGLCRLPWCPNEAAAGTWHKLCPECRERARERTRRVRAARKAAGLCLSCGDQPEAGRARCRKCLDRVNRCSQASKLKHPERYPERREKNG